MKRDPFTLFSVLGPVPGSGWLCEERIRKLLNICHTMPKCSFHTIFLFVLSLSLSLSLYRYKTEKVIGIQFYSKISDLLTWKISTKLVVFLMCK